MTAYDDVNGCSYYSSNGILAVEVIKYCNVDQLHDLSESFVGKFVLIFESETLNLRKDKY